MSSGQLTVGSQQLAVGSRQSARDYKKDFYRRVIKFSIKKEKFIQSASDCQLPIADCWTVNSSLLTG